MWNGDIEVRLCVGTEVVVQQAGRRMEGQTDS